MKKALSIILAVVLMAAMSVSAFADNFTPSIEQKTAPEIGIVEVSDGHGGSKACSALIVTTANTDNIIQGVPGQNQSSSDELIFYVISVAEREAAVVPEITAALESAESQVKAVSNVGQLGGGSVSAKINEEIKAFNVANATDINADDLVVSDLFDASLVLNETTIHKLAEGQSCAFMIKPNFSKNDFFAVLHNTEGTSWEVIENVEWVTVDGEDYLKVTVDHLSAFALVVEKTVDLPVDPQGPNSPQTNNKDGYMFLFAGIAVLCVGIAVFFFVQAKKRRKAQ